MAPKKQARKGTSRRDTCERLSVNNAKIMSSGTQPSDEEMKKARELVSAFKKDGKFDELRRKVLAEVMASDSFASATAEARSLTADVVSAAPQSYPKSKVRDMLREQMNSRLGKKLEGMVDQQLGLDSNIQFILNEIGLRVKASLGLNEVEEACVSKAGAEKGKSLEDDHQSGYMKAASSAAGSEAQEQQLRAELPSTSSSHLDSGSCRSQVKGNGTYGKQDSKTHKGGDGGGKSQVNAYGPIVGRTRRERKMPCSKDFVYY